VGYKAATIEAAEAAEAVSKFKFMAIAATPLWISREVRNKKQQQTMLISHLLSSFTKFVAYFCQLPCLSIPTPD